MQRQGSTNRGKQAGMFAAFLVLKAISCKGKQSCGHAYVVARQYALSKLD